MQPLQPPFSVVRPWFDQWLIVNRLTPGSLHAPTQPYRDTARPGPLESLHSQSPQPPAARYLPVGPACLSRRDVGYYVAWARGARAGPGRARARGRRAVRAGPAGPGGPWWLGVRDQALCAGPGRAAARTWPWPVRPPVASRRPSTTQAANRYRAAAMSAPALRHSPPSAGSSTCTVRAYAPSAPHPPRLPPHPPPRHPPPTPPPPQSRARACARGCTLLFTRLRPQSRARLAS